MELKTNTGRNRLNLLGAYSPDDHTLVSIEETASCDAALVCQLLRKLRATHPDGPLLLVLDNARYQRAYLVPQLAAELGITLQFLPPYSPNLNLIERFWKFLRKHVTPVTNTIRPLRSFGQQLNVCSPILRTIMTSSPR